jgi:hypothetical protein
MNKFKSLLAIALISTTFIANAANTNKPFGRGALSDAQLQAWQINIDNEAGLLNCTYEDDPRITEDMDGLLSDLSNGVAMEPVQVTYRTLLNMGPHSRELISRNIKVASMDCNNIYYSGTDMIGTPLIPFEEALTIMHDDYANYQSAERLLELKKTFIVVSMDPRWFWAYFVADKAHMDLIGLDYETLLSVDAILAERKTPRQYTDDSYNLLHGVFQGMNNYGLAYYSANGKCNSSGSEPSKSIIVWPEITDDIVKNLYNLHRVKYKGKWKNKVDISKGQVSIYQEKPIDNNIVPAFTVTRGLTIYSNSCER